MSEPEVPLQNMALDFSAKDPVCGMTLEPLQARGKAQYRGETYFFCSPGCMHKFTATPAKYIKDAAADDSSASAAPAPAPSAKKLAKDPVCGMSVDPSNAASTAEYDGKLYHFCSRNCGEKFRKDPARYLTTANKPTGMTGMVQIGGAPVQLGASRRLEKDLVCGMNVDPSAAAATVNHIGKTYYFCCRGCAEKFQASPGKYLSPGSSPAKTAAESTAVPAPARKGTAYVCPMDPEIRQDHPGACPKCGMALEPDVPIGPTKTQWTCPMHPEIVRDEPGACPICGMGLEPMTVSAGEEENPELREMTWRFWTSVVLGIPLVAFAMLRMSSWSALHPATPGQLGGVRAGYTDRAVVRMAVFPARLGVGKVPQPEHVHADRHGRRRGLPLQRCLRPLSRRSFRPPCARWAASPKSTSKPRLRSSRWCCWGRFWSCARAAAPAAPSAHCSTCRPRWRASCAKMAVNTMFRSTR